MFIALFYEVTRVTRVTVKRELFALNAGYRGSSLVVRCVLHRVFL